MKNILLTIEYDGSGFSGWQIQPNARTIQGELEAALSRVMGEPISLTGSSRTDAGVHALGAAANFRTHSGIPVERVPIAVNDLLSDIRVIEATEMAEDFSARAHAVSKTYCYKIITPSDCIASSCEPDIFLRNYRYLLNDALDEDNMATAAGFFIGTHDFSSFRTLSHDAPENTQRTIFSLSVKATDTCDTHGMNVREFLIRVNGNAFLYNMVRIIAGTLVEIGLGKRKAGDIPDIIAANDRGLAGHTAPAAGLYLERVYYGKWI